MSGETPNANANNGGGSGSSSAQVQQRSSSIVAKGAASVVNITMSNTGVLVLPAGQSKNKQLDAVDDTVLLQSAVEDHGNAEFMAILARLNDLVTFDGFNLERFRSVVLEQVGGNVTLLHKVLAQSFFAMCQRSANLVKASNKMSDAGKSAIAVLTNKLGIVTQPSNGDSITWYRLVTGYYDVYCIASAHYFMDGGQSGTIQFIGENKDWSNLPNFLRFSSAGSLMGNGTPFNQYQVAWIAWALEAQKKLGKISDADWDDQKVANAMNYINMQINHADSPPAVKRSKLVVEVIAGWGNVIGADGKVINAVPRQREPQQ
jgi:hypothetical protein